MIESGGFFDYDQKKARLEELEQTIDSIPDFWSNPERSTPILKEKKNLEDYIAKLNLLKSKRDDAVAALEMAEAGEEDFFLEASQLASLISKDLKQLELQSLLNGETDQNPCILTINAGAGGTESQDWVQILMRMFLRFAEKKGWTTEIYDVLAGDEAGVKNVSFEVNGPFAYGFLKSESGVHRLVRISPFDSNARRHTSVASVFVTPVVDDTIEITINDADLKVDTYRASGAGGQHVNKTDSAIRITHIPTGIVVACQTQRSQHQNRDQAMKMLRSKLYEAEMNKRQEAINAQENAKTDISFGHQIRSYVLHPYKLVKDHRTDFESHDPDEVLDGGLDPFIQSYLVEELAKSKKIDS